jgi:predicted RNA-binding Zn-ribbon protein involved in translation (DUF1610 family)
MAQLRYPDHVRLEDRPDANPDNVPTPVLEEAVENAVMYGACPECGEAQFYPFKSGYNTLWDCKECGFTMMIVG